VESLRDFALRPLRHYADFRGRSQRTELIAFFALIMAIGAFHSLVPAVASLRAVFWISVALHLALGCPAAALMVRRLHDTGRTGWWALLALPVPAGGLWYDYSILKGRPFPVPDSADPLRLAAALLSLALLVLLLWADDPEANRYGSNPRHDEATDDDQSA